MDAFLKVVMMAPRVSFLPSSLLTNPALLQGGRPEADYPDLGGQQIPFVFVVLSSQSPPLSHRDFFLRFTFGFNP